MPRPQLHGRWDNSELYDSWYLSCSAVGAVAESFYNKQRWVPEVFLTPAGHSRSLAVFEFEEPLPLVNLDDAEALQTLKIRPSQVVVQDLAKTQRIARTIHAQYSTTRAGISWWSSQLPSETSVLLWGNDGVPPVGLKLVGLEALSVDHPAVIDAASKLYRVLG